MAQLNRYAVCIGKHKLLVTAPAPASQVSLPLQTLFESAKIAIRQKPGDSNW